MGTYPSYISGWALSWTIQCIEKGQWLDNGSNEFEHAAKEKRNPEQQFH